MNDYHYFESIGKQCHTAGISRYLPTTSTGCGYPDTYQMRSAMNNGLTLWTAWAPGAEYEVYRRFLPPETPWQPNQSFPIRHAKALATEFRRVRNYFFGDFYPLTPYSTADDVWMAYQFHLQNKDAGMVLIFRRERCGSARTRVSLRTLGADNTYELRFYDDNLRRVIRVSRGHELTEGLELTIPQALGSLLIEYRRR